MVMSCADVYDPGLGLNTGAVTRGPIVYAPDVTDDVLQPTR
jgi:hypothetical protein